MKRKNLAHDILAGLRQADADEVLKSYAFGEKMNMTRVSPESMISMEENMATAAEKIETYTAMARKEISEHPEEYAKPVNLRLDIKVEQTSDGAGLGIDAQFRAEGADGNPKSITGCGFGIERRFKKGGDMDKEKASADFWAQTVVRGIWKIADQYGVKAWGGL